MSEKPWYRLSLGDGVWAPQAISELEQAFSIFLEAAGRPRDMAVFSRPLSEGRLQCEIMAYFAPAAGEFARERGAIVCARPARAGLTLIAGSPEAWESLFTAAASR